MPNYVQEANTNFVTTRKTATSVTVVAVQCYIVWLIFNKNEKKR